MGAIGFYCVLDVALATDLMGQVSDVASYETARVFKLRNKPLARHSVSFTFPSKFEGLFNVRVGEAQVIVNNLWIGGDCQDAPPWSERDLLHVEEIAR